MTTNKHKFIPALISISRVCTENETGALHKLKQEFNMKHSSHPVKTANIKQSLQVICTATTMLFTQVAYAGDSLPHHDTFSCYVSVHDSCYGQDGSGGDWPCSTETYNEFLNMCDVAYPSSKAVPKPVFTGTPPSQKVINGSEYKKKIQKLRSSIRRK